VLIKRIKEIFIYYLFFPVAFSLIGFQWYKIQRIRDNERVIAWRMERLIRDGL
jgi:hypothetical protein